MIDLKFDYYDVMENPIRWLGTNAGNTEDSSLDRETWYNAEEFSLVDNCLKITDNAGELVWVDSIDFEIVPLEEQYKNQMEEHSKKLEEYNKSLKPSSNNFTTTLNGDVFKVEAVGLSDLRVKPVFQGGVDVN